MTTETLLTDAQAIEWAQKFMTNQGGPQSPQQARGALRYRAEALAGIDPDDRLSYLETPEWQFSTDHITQVNAIIHRFIDTTARHQIQELAKLCLDHGDHPLAIAEAWLTKEKFQELMEMVDQTNVPDQLITACYAWMELHETALAIHALESFRRAPRPSFDNFTQTPEEEEADLRFNNLT